MNTLREADQARSEFAAIESDLQFIMSQLAQLSTRAYASRMTLMAIATVWAVIAAVALPDGAVSSDALR